MPYQCKAFSTALRVLATLRRIRPPGFVDMVCHTNAQVLAQHCVLDTWRRIWQPGIVYCGAISMHRPPAQHCVCCAHCREKKLIRGLGLVCHAKAQAPSTAKCLLNIAKNMQPRYVDWCVTLMPRPPAQHPLCLQHREDQGHQVSLIGVPY